MRDRTQYSEYEGIIRPLYEGKKVVVRTKLIESHTASHRCRWNVLGTPGAIVRDHHAYTFKVWYGDGHTEIKTVPVGSRRYKEFMDKLDL